MRSLYRRHRPRSFEDVVGQEHVVRTLRNAVEQEKVHHAYLFVGSRGTGKTSMAKILSSVLNCEEAPPAAACGECESCRSIADGSSLDVVEMDAASNRSVDDIRDLRDRVAYAPAAGRWKVYILDEAHMLTKEAWNAFLKTLEEPPPNTVFVLATTEAHKVMATIVDRCQRFDFQRPSVEQIATVLGRVSAAESIDIADPARAMVARAAAGSFRDALGTLDQLVAYSGESIALDDVLAVLGVADSDLIFRTVDAVIDSQPAAALDAIAEVDHAGRDLVQFARDLLAHFRHLLVVRATGAPPDSFAVTASDPERMVAQAGSLSDDTIVRTIEEIATALRDVKEGGDPRVMLEVALLKAARPSADASVAALMDRVARLEGGAPAPAPLPAQEKPAAPVAPAAAPAPALDPVPEPQADPDPAPEARSESSLPDFDRVLELWPAVVDQFREGGSILAHLFDGARPVRIDDGRLTVGFPAEAPFNKKKAEVPENRERVADALRSVFGAALQPVYSLLESREEDASEEAPPEVDDEELLDRLKSAFAATEVPPSADSND